MIMSMSTVEEIKKLKRCLDEKKKSGAIRESKLEKAVNSLKRKDDAYGTYPAVRGNIERWNVSCGV